MDNPPRGDKRSLSLDQSPKRRNKPFVNISEKEHRDWIEKNKANEGLKKFNKNALEKLRSFFEARVHKEDNLRLTYEKGLEACNALLKHIGEVNIQPSEYNALQSAALLAAMTKKNGLKQITDHIAECIRPMTLDKLDAYLPVRVRSSQSERYEARTASTSQTDAPSSPQSRDKEIEQISNPSSSTKTQDIKVDAPSFPNDQASDAHLMTVFKDIVDQNTLYSIKQQLSLMSSVGTQRSVEVHGLCNKILVEHYELTNRQRKHLTNISDLPSLECAIILNRFLQTQETKSKYMITARTAFDNWYRQTHPTHPGANTSIPQQTGGFGGSTASGFEGTTPQVDTSSHFPQDFTSPTNAPSFLHDQAIDAGHLYGWPVGGTSSAFSNQLDASFPTGYEQPYDPTHPQASTSIPQQTGGFGWNTASGFEDTTPYAISSHFPQDFTSPTNAPSFLHDQAIDAGHLMAEFKHFITNDMLRELRRKLNEKANNMSKTSQEAAKTRRACTLCNKILIEHYSSELTKRQRTTIEDKVSELSSLDCACELRTFLQNLGNIVEDSNTGTVHQMINNWYDIYVQVE